MIRRLGGGAPKVGLMTRSRHGLDRLLRRGYEDWLKRQLNETIIRANLEETPWG